jgi:hypothetical protein
MGTVALVVPGVVPRHPQVAVKTPSFVIASMTTGKKITLPLAPLPTTHSGFGPNWETIGRGGRAGFLVPTDRQTRLWSATLTVAHPADRVLSIDPLLHALEQLRGSTDRITLTYSRAERGVWRFIDLSYDVLQRQPGTNEPTQASVVISVQEAVDIPTIIGPKRASGAATKANPPVPVKTPKSKSHTVRAGETLITISLAEYGDALQWRRIGDANGLRAASPLTVGKVLKLP